MILRSNVLIVIRHIQSINFNSCIHTKGQNEIPFLDFYHKITGKTIPFSDLPKLKKKHPKIDMLHYDNLNCTIRILEKFGITPLEACNKPHVFIMNPITMDNYGEILRECGFTTIMAKYIIKYHTLVKSYSVANLKKKGLIPNNLILEEMLLKCFSSWQYPLKPLSAEEQDSSSILSIRMRVLEAYLQWRLNITQDDFTKYCRNYLPLKHKPMSDIQEAINYAETELKINPEIIRRNGFIISADPVKTKLIVENVDQLAGLDIREVISLEPAILKNNYQALLEIRDILKEYRISNTLQKNCLRIYCMCPKTVRERFQELATLKEYQVLANNQRVLYLVVHKKKMLERLSKIQKTTKQCFSLNHLVASQKVFNSYINSFGNKVCSRDMATLICHSLDMFHIEEQISLDTDRPRAKLKTKDPKTVTFTINQLKRHNYLFHVALNVIDDNIKELKKYFNNDIIFNNCQLLLYPMSDIQHYVEQLLQMRNSTCNLGDRSSADAVFANFNYNCLTDDQILSLVLYYIERKHHFTGDGIWGRNEQQKVSSRAANCS